MAAQSIVFFRPLLPFLCCVDLTHAPFAGLRVMVRSPMMQAMTRRSYGSLPVGLVLHTERCLLCYAIFSGTSNLKAAFESSVREQRQRAASASSEQRGSSQQHQRAASASSEQPAASASGEQHQRAASSISEQRAASASGEQHHRAASSISEQRAASL